ncbi:MAG: sulfotransferase [Chloroflexota bacterium]
MQPETQPILVTGAHRTGTTWVGRLLAADPHLAYISEPLNVLHRRGVFRTEVEHWYTYICSENEREYLPSFLELLSYRYHLAGELASIRSVRDLGRMARDMTVFVRGRLGQQTALLKDPFAVFSLRWFAQALNCRIVVTVRHPAAFASGLRRLNWCFDFENLLKQPLLMRDHLEPYRGLMRSDVKGDVIGQAGLLWAIIYATLRDLRPGIPALEVVRHEDLATDPAEGFRQLYRQLGLEYTRRVQRAVLASSSSGNPVELSKRRVHSVKLDSRASLQNWRQRLSGEEVARVRRLTEDVAQLYYPEESWN